MLGLIKFSNGSDRGGGPSESLSVRVSLGDLLLVVIKHLQIEISGSGMLLWSHMRRLNGGEDL